MIQRISHDGILQEEELVPGFYTTDEDVKVWWDLMRKHILEE